MQTCFCVSCNNFFRYVTITVALPLSYRGLFYLHLIERNTNYIILFRIVYSKCFYHVPSKLHTRNLVHPLTYLRFGHALDRLVAVSSIHYCTSTSALSTLSSSRGLTTCVGISHLEGGFTLRCLQRLSPPGLATLP